MCNVSLGRPSGGDWSNTCHWTKRFIRPKQEVAASAVTSTFSSLSHSQLETFMRTIIIIMCINYTII